MSGRTMRCAYCGETYSWFDGQYWVSRLFAQCWACYEAEHPPVRPPLWKRVVWKLTGTRWFS